MPTLEHVKGVFRTPSGMESFEKMVSNVNLTL